MLGHSYAGSMQHQHQKTQTAFAWIPKRSTFGKKFIWLQKYYVVSIFSRPQWQASDFKSKLGLYLHRSGVPDASVGKRITNNIREG